MAKMTQQDKNVADRLGEILTRLKDATEKALQRRDRLVAAAPQVSENEYRQASFKILHDLSAETITARRVASILENQARQHSPRLWKAVEEQAKKSRAVWNQISEDLATD